ncbi:hypothetical protein Catovirus_1_433 [Catovirus CTV1]|uniref:Uncharacterized protein n=1 Tax=Catovirus CTV1 TaxID=1977631 RepID=A0A1V0S9K6_9VIRU|nr:hypothetical protein Catovirus_1_433 [Catovirus CTV1]
MLQVIQTVATSELIISLPLTLPTAGIWLPISLANASHKYFKHLRQSDPKKYSQLFMTSVRKGMTWPIRIVDNIFH